MIAEIEQADGTYRDVEAPPRCGDYCDTCGDCLHCSHETGNCDGRWVLYRGIDDERIAELTAARDAFPPPPSDTPAPSDSTSRLPPTPSEGR
jgi:hypothetical protein